MNSPMVLPYKPVTLQRGSQRSDPQRFEHQSRGLDPFWLVFWMGWCAGLVTMAVLIRLAQHFGWGVFG